MNTQYYVIEGDSGRGPLTDADLSHIAAAGKIIASGGLTAFPTETVYGLGGDALNKESSRKIYAAKGRPSDNPLIVHIAALDDLYKITEEVPKKALKLAEAFWPGPLTMIFKKSDIVPHETTGGLNTVAVRMPGHETALELIRQSGGYIAAPSANLSGRPSPTKGIHVREDMDGRIDAIIDGGESVIGLESTIVDMTEDIPIILRPGYITINSLSRVVGDVIYDPAILSLDADTAPRAPGMKYRHYAPKGELSIVKGERDAVCEYIKNEVSLALRGGKKAGIIATDETAAVYEAYFAGKGVCIKNIGSRDDEVSIARALYSVLREFDEAETEVMYSEELNTPDIGQAIMNRLIKAAGHNIINVK